MDQEGPDGRARCFDRIYACSRWMEGCVSTALTTTVERRFLRRCLVETASARRAKQAAGDKAFAWHSLNSS